MRLERLNMNKIKVFLTFDDLSERGLTKEDLWQDLPKVHQLFRDMINEASDELGFEADGPIAVEIFSLKAQGMVMIVTKENYIEIDDEDDEFNDEYIQMQVTVDETHEISYVFSDFENVINVSECLFNKGISGGKLYSFENVYYLQFDELEFLGHSTENMISILSEFGNPSTLTIARLEEYGKLLMEKNAISQLVHYFK